MPEPDGSQYNICFVVLDAVQARYLSAYGHDRRTSPTVETLVEEDDAARFDRIVSPSGATVDSVGSIMSGLYPIEHRTGNRGGLKTPTPTLPEYLSDRGYRTGMVTCNPFLTPWFDFDRGVDEFNAVTHRFADGINVQQFFDDHRDLPQYRRYLAFLREALGRNLLANVGNGLQWKFGLFEGKDDGAEAATDWARTFVDGESPWFCYVHYTETHMTTRGQHPYTIPDAAQRQFLPEGVPSGIELKDAGPEADYTDEQLRVHRRLYEGAIWYLDQQFARLRDRLKSLGQWDETLVVLTADHGECIGENGRLGHGILYEPGVRIPLVVKPPASGPVPVPAEMPTASRTNLLGMYRTIAQSLGDEPEYLRGPDLFNEAPSSVMVQNFASTWEWSRYADDSDPWIAFYTGGLKLLQQGDHREVYEMDGAWTEGPQVTDEETVDRLADALATELDALDAADASDGEVQVDDETEQRLRELGYID
jgi:arylsulfatase A-like enzyme